MIKQTWANLSPQKKKWTVIGVAIGGVLLFVWGLSSLGGEVQRKTNAKPTITNVLTDADRGLRGYPGEQPLGGQDSAGRPGRALFRARRTWHLSTRGMTISPPAAWLRGGRDRFGKSSLLKRFQADPWWSVLKSWYHQHLLNRRGLTTPSGRCYPVITGDNNVEKNRSIGRIRRSRARRGVVLSNPGFGRSAARLVYPPGRHIGIRKTARPYPYSARKSGSLW